MPSFKSATGQLISIIAMAGVSFGTTPCLDTVTQPIFYGGSDERVQYMAIPKVVNHLHPEFKAYLYSSPTRPEGNDDVDLNLISTFGIKVELTRSARVKGQNNATEDRSRQFTVDVSKLVVPEGWTLSPLQAGQMAAKAVRMDFKDTKLTEIIITDGKKVWSETAGMKDSEKQRVPYTMAASRSLKSDLEELQKLREQITKTLGASWKVNPLEPSLSKVLGNVMSNLDDVSLRLAEVGELTEIKTADEGRPLVIAVRTASDKNLKTGQALKMALRKYNYKVGSVRPYSMPNKVGHVCAVYWSGKPQDRKKIETLSRYLEDHFPQGGVVLATTLAQTGARLETGHALIELGK